MAPETLSVCVIVPAYNEEGSIAEVLGKMPAGIDEVVVIDDGSSDATGKIAREHGATVIRNETNAGKGVALMAGFAHAHAGNMDLVITLDADGQHDPADIVRFVDTFRRTRVPVLVGNRLWDRKKMPVVRRWTNLFMSCLLARIMGVYVADSQCGFRLYRADLLRHVQVAARRFAMESEILLQLARRGIRIDSVRIPVVYRGERSRIRPIADTVRFFAMLARYHHEQKMKRG